MAAAGFSSEWSPARRLPGSLAPRQPKAGRGARRGSKTWEQAADGFEELRAPLDRLPPFF